MNSFLSYMGGKSLLANKIIPRMPEHDCYCEVFAGAAWMLFKKEESDVEIINDINTDLVTLYRVVKHHLEEFVRYFKWALVARDEFKRLLDEKPETLTDIQRAARFYYLLRNSFGSKIPSPVFSIATSRPSNFNLLRIEEELSSAHLRLSRVYIENLPYEKLIPRFDRTNTFFYLDPPYFGCENYYGKNIFQREDFEKIRGILAGISGKFIMSINDTPETRELYKDFHIAEVSTIYQCTRNKRPKITELLISNF
ncbi:MAG: DNA adenine methylase [Candidatus Schekmanbacteria bacterium]|nr:DNA adenine methylase [Candidatus Schekmanbacteria bacterium]